MSDNTFFVMLKALYSKTDMDYDDKTLNPYLMLLWCSHDKDSFQYVESIAKYLYVIKHQYLWQYLRHKLPYNRNKFIKYVKKDKLDNEQSIEELCDEYQISPLEASLYV